MESKAKALGHPIHQMLIPFPFGLLATAVIFDVIPLVRGNPAMATVAFWMIIAGIVGGHVDPENLNQMPALFQRTAMSLFIAAGVLALLVIPIRRMMRESSAAGSH